MDAVLRSLAVYGFLFVVFRVVGKRTLAQITTFDFVLLLLIGEATQQGLLGEDFSVTNSMLVISTLALVEIATGWAAHRWRSVDTALNGVSLLIVDEGRMIEDRMDRARVTKGDVLEAARQHHGLERLDQVRFAILERDGAISVVPRHP